MFSRMTRFNTLALAASAALSLTSIAIAQTTYYVNGSCGDDSWTGLSPICEAPDGPKATIQAGIDAGDHFDSVEVADGIYRGLGNKNLEFFTKEMSIHSAGGPTNCIIDCENDGFGFTFCTLPDDRPVTIEGFTIRNGRHSSAGGICIYAADVTIDNCIIERCVGTGFAVRQSAGGILISRSAARIVRSIIRENSAQFGGGVHIYDSSEVEPVVIEDCRIERNRAESGSVWGHIGGGGIYVSAAAMRMSRCLIVENVVSGSSIYGSAAGAGVYVSISPYEPSVIEHTEFRGNGIGPDMAGFSSAGGGANLGSGVIMRDCTVSDNEAALGGGLYLVGTSSDLVERVEVSGNHARQDGGGVWCGATLGRSLTIRGNTAGRDGGGVYFGTGNASWTGLEIVGNHAARNGGGAFAKYQLNLSHSLLKGNRADGDGGAAHSSLGPSLIDCLAIDNTAGRRGGAIFVLQSGDRIINSTFARNEATAGGGALHVEEEGYPLELGTHSCIFRENHPVSIFDASGSLVVNRSNVEGGWPGIGNLDVDPRFCDPSVDDFRLLPGSPCIDSGRGEARTSEFDLAGEPRSADDPGMPDAGLALGAIVDMGCYEFQGTSTGFIAVHPRPGIAGQNNQLQAAGATPGNVVYFVYGFASGSTGVPGCPGVNVEIANPRIAAQATADGSGYASRVIGIPGAAAGRSIVLQAVDHDACGASNVVGYRFP